MFVSGERLLAVSFDAAASRLARLARGDGWLRGQSQAAYDDGVQYLLRVGPAGAVPGASRLVRVRFTEPARRDQAMTVGMRWEASGITGGLFPALDADIRLTHDDGHGTRVTLTGSYRPPLGTLGEGLDRLLLRTVAIATIRTLLTEIAAAVQAEAAGSAQTAAPREPEPGPALG